MSSSPQANRAKSSSSASWNRALSVPVGLGLMAWLVLAVWAPLPLSVAPTVPRDLRWVLDLGVATVAAHLVFTLSVSVLSWRKKPWEPGPTGSDEALLCFDAAPPRFSFAYGLCTLLTLVAWAQPEKAVQTDGFLQFPSAGLRLLMLSGLVSGAAWLWGRWLCSVGRFVVRDGVAAWSDRHESLRLDEFLVSGPTIVGARDGVSICVRLPGGPRNQAWQPSSRIGEPRRAEGYRAAGDAPRGLAGAFFASSAERPRPVPVFPFFPILNVGGDVRRWYRLLPLALLCGLFAVSVVLPPDALGAWWGSRRDSGFATLFALALLFTLGTILFLVASYWMSDIPWRPAGPVDGVWLWRLLSQEPPRSARLSRVALGLHLAGSGARRISVALLFLVLWCLVALAFAVALTLVVFSFDSLGWFAPAMLLPAAAQWITMTSYRLPVRVKDGLLSIQRAGVWLPVTRVDAEGEAIVLSAGPVRVRAQELYGFAKPREASVTASLIWPFCAPATVFLASGSNSSSRGRQ